MSRIYWEKYPKHVSLLPEPVQDEFEKLYTGIYQQRTRLSHDLVSLNDMLKDLTSQELDIFLDLKGEYATDYDVTFTEVLLHSLDNTSTEAKTVILNALKYIVSNNKNSRAYILKQPHTLERLASSNGNNAELSKDVLQIAENKFCVPRKVVHHFNAGETFQFFTTLTDIYERASGSLTIVDNYASNEIFEYIYNYSDCSKITDITIVCNKNVPRGKAALKRVGALQQAASKFVQEYPNINIELRSSSDVHDRYIITDKEVWHLGPSLKDGGKKVCTINQLKEENESIARSSISTIIKNSTSI